MKLYHVDFTNKESIYDSHSVILIADSEPEAIEGATRELKKTEIGSRFDYLPKVVAAVEINEAICFYTGM